MGLRTVLLVLLALLVASPVFAATLTGTVYDQNLDVATNVLVSIDTQPEQRLLSTDGSYSFSVPPGNYTLKVQYLKDGLNETSTEQVMVSQDGTFTYDLFLLPGLDEEESLFDDLTTDLAEAPSDPFGNDDGIWPVIVLILFILAVIIIPIVVFRRYWNKLNKELAAEEAVETKLEEDEKLLKVLSILKREGGRMTQKELRKEMGDSEAKVSLLITELEAKGKVQKIKKGRGNVLVLKS